MNSAEVIAMYTMQIRPLGEEMGGGFEAFYTQLSRGVVGYGPTPQESVADLIAALPAFLEAVHELGQTVPAAEVPRAWDEFSGKFNVRVPKLLHMKLARLAESQGASLNSMIQSILASGVTALECGYEFGIRGKGARSPDAGPVGQRERPVSGRQALTPVGADQVTAPGRAATPADEGRATVPPGLVRLAAMVVPALAFLGPAGALAGVAAISALARGVAQSRPDLAERLIRLQDTQPNLQEELARALPGAPADRVISPAIVAQIEQILDEMESTEVASQTVASPAGC